MSQGDFDEVKALLRGRALALAQHLMPEGHRAGAYWIGRSRAHDKKVGGLWVAVSGTPGAWRDEVAGKKGDILDLIAWCVFGADKCRLVPRDVGNWARDFLGLASMAPEVRKRAAQTARAAQVDNEKQQAAQLARSRKRARAWWLESKKAMFIGSPADIYLQSRAIDIRTLPRMPACLGWLPDHEHYESLQVLETGELPYPYRIQRIGAVDMVVSRWPCMLHAFCDAAGKVGAVHRTWLMPDGSGKAPLRPLPGESEASVRKIFPAFGGMAMWLHRGESGLSIGDAAKHGLRETFVLVEGNEDGWSSVMSAPQYRTWAFGALGNLQSLILPECCDEAIVARDNDWSNPQAARNFDKGIQNLLEQGKRVRVARSSVGKDLSDALMSPATT